MLCFHWDISLFLISFFSIRFIFEHTVSHPYFRLYQKISISNDFKKTRSLSLLTNNVLRKIPFYWKHLRTGRATALQLRNRCRRLTANKFIFLYISLYFLLNRGCSALLLLTFFYSLSEFSAYITALNDFQM